MKKLIFASICMAIAAFSTTACSYNSTGSVTHDSAAPSEKSTEGSSAAAISDFDVSHKILVCSREDGSGTRGAFIELMGIEQKDSNGNKVDMTTVNAQITNSTAVMMTTVAGDKYSIGYISLGSLDSSVKAVQIEGVDATVDNIKSGDYTVSRPFNIVTGENLSDIAQDFYNYIMSSEGQAIIEENHYIPVSEGEFISNGASGKIAVTGSSSVSPVMEKLTEAYEAINSNADIEIQTNDSTSGITSAMEGTCDIGMASRDLKDTETGVYAATIAMDGIAVIVNLDNPVDNMTKEQVMNIYTDGITDWSSLID